MIARNYYFHLVLFVLIFFTKVLVIDSCFKALKLENYLALKIHKKYKLFMELIVSATARILLITKQTL